MKTFKANWVVQVYPDGSSFGIFCISLHTFIPLQSCVCQWWLLNLKGEWVIITNEDLPNVHVWSLYLHLQFQGHGHFHYTASYVTKKLKYLTRWFPISNSSPNKKEYRIQHLQNKEICWLKWSCERNYLHLNEAIKTRWNCNLWVGYHYQLKE